MEEDNTNKFQGNFDQFLEDPNEAIIKVIGVGGGGSNAVNYMYRQDIPKVNFVVCNTDKQHLDKSPVPHKLILGWDVTHGRGAGNDPDTGRKCAEASEEDIRKLFRDETEMVFITAGMGGGTGTGAAPVVARIAKEEGMLTIGIVTVPFMFEGDKKIIKALDGANALREHVDALLMINNENLIELYPDLNIFNAFQKADDTLANAARSISEIISEDCMINVDFQDVRYVLRDSGTAIISTAYGEGENRISDAIHNALHSPLMKAHDIYSSKRLLLKFTCSSESLNEVRSREINQVTDFTNKLPSTIDVKWGIRDDPSMGDKMKVTVLASGFDVTIRKNDQRAKEGNKEQTIVFENPTTREEEKQLKEQSVTRIAEIYGSDKVKQQRRNTARLKFAVLTPDQLDDHEVIALIESVPATNRDPRFHEELKKITENISTPGITPNDKQTDKKNPDTIYFG